MSPEVQGLLLVLGTVLTALVTILVGQLAGIRKELRQALDQLETHKTALQINGLLDPVGKPVHHEL